MGRLAVVTVLVSSLVFGACAAEQSSSALDAQIDDLQTELAALRAERDVLAAAQAAAEERFAKTTKTFEMTNAIVSDPHAFGTEDEVMKLLGDLSVPGAITHDLAYGEVESVEGWRNTLFKGSVDAETYVWHDWVCADGSQAGSIWTWRGLNPAGEPFELIGMNISEFNLDGLQTHQTVAWPYPNVYVYEQFGS